LVSRLASTWTVRARSATATVPGAERVASTSRGLTARTESPAAPTPRPTPAPTLTTPNETVQKVHEDVATAKAAKCKEAQESYEQTIAARRLLKQGPNGEQIYLNDEEIDAARVAARSTMEYYCGK